MEHLLFPTRIDTFDLSDHPDLITACNIVRRQERQTSPHVLVSNAASSYPTNMPSILNHIALYRLKQTIQSHISKIANELQLAPVEITNSWFNVMNKGHSVKPHRHERSIISGALYIEAESNSVGLKFHSPLAQCRMAEFLFGSNHLNENYHEVECKVGQLILFPGWLEHSTDENRSDRRVVISFNSEHGPLGKVQEAHAKWVNNQY